MPDAQTSEAAAEWLLLIERQQQEIEALRAELAGPGSSGCRSPSTKGGWASPPRYSSERRGSNASVASSVSSLAFSVLSMGNDDTSVPMDSERYAKICEKMEAMRSALATKDATLRKARAQVREGQRVAGRLRETVAELRSLEEAQRAQLVRERAATQEAVAKAVDKAAQALVDRDCLKEKVAELEQTARSLRNDLETGANALKTTETSHGELQAELRRARQESTRMTNEILASRNEKVALQDENRRLQQSVEAQRSCEDKWGEVNSQKLALQTRVNELQSLFHQRNVQLKQQSEEIEQQRQQIRHLEESQARLKRSAATERADDQQHATHLLKQNLSLQHQLDIEHTWKLQHKAQSGELHETVQMLAEELHQSKSQTRFQVQMLTQRGEKYAALASSYRRLERHAQTLELSERQLSSLLLPAKKRLVFLQNALARFCYELEGVSKTMLANRNRLLHQCQELEKCLDSCQNSASETQTRAEGLDKENAVLQHAVTQLVAYAQELVGSQQSLQRELTQLEIVGSRQPFVYG
ncbi:hypothetical protein BBJ28_00016575 [Nothophytophthora sp. Chile5]|nr:hypothetical protein BBJ28_00016575 [Nothophytophthora sp. Chile5]